MTVEFDELCGVLFKFCLVLLTILLIYFFRYLSNQTAVSNEVKLTEFLLILCADLKKKKISKVGGGLRDNFVRGGVFKSYFDNYFVNQMKFR